MDEQDLIDAIQRGQAELDKRERAAAEVAETRRILAQLSSRETEVLELIAKGLTTRQIAEALTLSPRTVESHRAAIVPKPEPLRRPS